MLGVSVPLLRWRGRFRPNGRVVLDEALMLVAQFVGQPTEEPWRNIRPAEVLRSQICNPITNEELVVITVAGRPAAKVAWETMAGRRPDVCPPELARRAGLHERPNVVPERDASGAVQLYTYMPLDRGLDTLRYGTLQVRQWPDERRLGVRALRRRGAFRERSCEITLRVPGIVFSERYQDEVLRGGAAVPCGIILVLWESWPNPTRWVFHDDGYEVGGEIIMNKGTYL